MDPTYQRGKAFNIAVLSMTLAAQGKVDEACTQGRIAINLAAGLTSARVYRYIRNVDRSLAPYGDERPVRDLREYADQRLPALRPRGGRP
ncbi:hypothetical protein [Actinomadura coerulea]|uniref:hypothetical protein n=1 Tax=Actinomadura coerulea TaxID=46159 RepID=UPI0034261046